MSLALDSVCVWLIQRVSDSAICFSWARKAWLRPSPQQLRTCWGRRKDLCLSGHHSLFSVHVISVQDFAVFIHAILPPRQGRSHRISYVHHSLCKFTGEWFTVHSNHIHRLTPITRAVATKISADRAWTARAAVSPTHLDFLPELSASAVFVDSSTCATERDVSPHPCGRSPKRYVCFRLLADGIWLPHPPHCCPSSPEVVPGKHVIQWVRLCEEESLHPRVSERKHQTEEGAGPRCEALWHRL